MGGQGEKLCRLVLVSCKELSYICFRPRAKATGTFRRPRIQIWEIWELWELWELWDKSMCRTRYAALYPLCHAAVCNTWRKLRAREGRQRRPRATNVRELLFYCAGSKTKRCRKNISAPERSGAKPLRRSEAVRSAGATSGCVGIYAFAEQMHDRSLQLTNTRRHSFSPCTLPDIVNRLAFPVLPVRLTTANALSIIASGIPCTTSGATSAQGLTAGIGV